MFRHICHSSLLFKLLFMFSASLTGLQFNLMSSTKRDDIETYTCFIPIAFLWNFVPFLTPQLFRVEFSFCSGGFWQSACMSPEATHLAGAKQGPLRRRRIQRLCGFRWGKLFSGFFFFTVWNHVPHDPFRILHLVKSSLAVFPFGCFIPANRVLCF